ncbi:HD domain-containing protein [Lacticaseibacillus hulanensis]|uniref:HD domain-containing protein n=1 Tax=Lacticaseibacillus hulanensis TaxID=2493111 RepID=UPI000FD6D208|nr:HD domain-containing protein [Lacticaseibacillus hulanensis]
MELYRQWEEDTEYRALIDDLLATPEVQHLADFKQHHHSNRLEHSLRVSYTSYLIAKKMHLDVRSTARAGLLHDLFYYDWRTTKFDLGTHAYVHPRIALHNAEHLTDLNKVERDIIIKHMWGATLAFPRYIESYIVSLVDDYAAVAEFSHPYKQKILAAIEA